MLSRLELSVEEFARIKRRCDERGILFLATPFGRAEVEQLVAMGASAIKLASSDLTNVELLDAAAATGLPLIVSTGASTSEEIEKSVKHLATCGAADRLVLLHCVSRYPAPIGSINLRVIRALHEAFGVPVGLSDHTTSTRTGALAVAAGACVLEKHFTLDRGAAGPDHAMSLAADELAAYVAAVREAESALGDGVIGMNEGEREVREAARRSVVASVAIAKGTRIARSMLTIKRPGTGIPGARVEELVGRVAATDIPSDTMLAWEMVR
jgi:N-acetylneuraminate synthase/N,N'-diacetyllegionaminate synthase